MNRTAIVRVHHGIQMWSVVGCLLLSTSFGFAEDIYKSIDSQGRPVYSDRPLSSDAERVTLGTKPRHAEAEEARVRRELAELTRRQEARNRQLAADSAKEQAREKADKEQADRCIAARNRYLMFVEANRLYRRDAAGNRVYYTSAEIDAERKASKRTMDETCADQQL